MRRMQQRLLMLAGLIGLALTGTTALAQDTASNSDTARRAIHVCASCHGEKGQSSKAGVPSLAGQMPAYVISQLRDFRSQTRVETGTKAYMWGVSALLDDATITDLANYYAAQAPAEGKPGAAALLRTGQQLFVAGAPERGVRACAGCHGTHGEGAAGFPRLAGQRADYVEAQLKVFDTKLRPHGVLMQAEVKSLKAPELRALAAYVQSL